MKVTSVVAARMGKALTSTLAVLSLASAANLYAQAPYALPYTIQSYAGGGTALTANPPVQTACKPTSNTAINYSNYGDGCQNTSASVVLGAGQALGNIHDINVDVQGNIYFLDLSSLNHTALRRIDARSGRVTTAAGTLGPTSGTAAICANATDSYGDGCPASDGLGNSAGGYTYYGVALRGFAVAKNGDIYITGYSTNVVQKISATTGLLTLVGGTLSGTGKSASGSGGFGGNGGPATSAHFSGPRGIAVDNSGNVYIADSGNNEIREINAATGIVTVVAGSATATSGYTGDGGPATSATLTTPEGVDIDAAGDIFIAAFGNSSVRVVYEGGAAAAKLISATNKGITPVVGSIYTVWGAGTNGYISGQYALGTSIVGTTVASGATAATTFAPRKIRLDSRGNVYISENDYNSIFFLDATTGYTHVVAGTYGVTTTSGGAGCTPLYGTTDAYGDNCPGTVATLNPNGAMSVTVDADENVYISDSGHDLIRKLATGRDFPSVATGTSVTQMLDIHFAAGDGPADNPFTITGNTDFTVGTPSCTANADATRDCLVPVTFKPTTGARESGVLRVSSLLNGVASIGVQGSGIAAEVALDPGAVTSVAATGLKLPQGAAVDATGNTYVADTGNNRVVAYSTTGAVTVFAGTGTASYTGDGGQAAAATLSSPSAVAVTPGNLVYIADTGNNVVRVVDPVTGIISTVAGGATTVCGDARDSEGDGCLGAFTKFSKPAGLAADIYGNVYVSDTGNNIVREISPIGYVSLVAGGASTICSSTTLTIDSFGDNCSPTQAAFNGPTGLAIDSNMNIYIADTGNNEVRKIVATSGLVTSFMGTGVAGDGGDGGQANVAQLNGPVGLGVDAAGNVYVADSGNDTIRTVTANGLVSAVEGIPGDSGSAAFTAVDEMGLNNPLGLAVLPSGNLVILDSGNNRLLADSRAGVTYNFGPTNVGSSSPLLNLVETEVGSAAATLGSPLFTPSGSSNYFTVSGAGSAGCSGGTSLAVGATCAFSAVFSPTSTVLKQTVSATFTQQNSNAVNSTSPVLNLSGTGATLTGTGVVVALTTPSVTPKYSLPFSVIATVTATACNTAAPTCYPTGNVTFFVDGQTLGVTTLGSGSGSSASATFTISQAIPIGAHQITAVYSSDTYYAANTSSALAITIAGAPSTSVVTAAPNPVAQFNAITFTATVGAASGRPTGSFSFYAGTTLLGTVGINASTGIASLPDTLVAATVTTPAYYQNFGLAAGTYNITAVYSGDANYSTSTSTAYSLNITALPQSFTSILVNPATALPSNIAVTYPGATTQLDMFVTPTNTLNGAVTFSCSGMPMYTDCGFTPSTLPFAPTPLFPTPQYTQVTFFTNVNPAVIGPGQAGFGRNWVAIGISVLLFIILRRKARRHRVWLLIPAFALVCASSTLFSGCASSNSKQSFVTALGTYNVNVTATGPNGQTVTLPVVFTVAAPTSN
ncbi:NHL repeat-containing protein [Granulicella rosea]|uniref:NHL repeat-containing protein n=1 Tax=Granulicella rosea TaxID=474952 RepID=A0A239M4R7_9BACT|nr:Ig-like domain repeat protein [Granulicella rosea]SNT37847.1 NHL repeat-containing protein [Granulicella rosea]